MKKIFLIFSLLYFSTFSSIFTQLTVKDQESIPNTLIQINDEGIFGSIFFSTAYSHPADPGSKLYSYAGNLFWNGNELATTSTAAGWQYDGTYILTSTINDKVGIGITTAPNVKLSLGTDFAPKKLAIWDGENDFYGFGSPFGRMAIFTSDVERMSILSNGNVGIGTTAPDASLEVNGYVKIGSNGVKFSDIIELSGETGTGGTDRVTISYPIGYNKNNTRVISYEVREVIADKWVSGDDGLWYALGNSDLTLGYGALYTNSYFRLIIMKVELILTRNNN